MAEVRETDVSQSNSTTKQRGMESESRPAESRFFARVAIIRKKKMRKNDCCDDAPAAEEPLVVPRTCARQGSDQLQAQDPSRKRNRCPHQADTSLRGSEAQRTRLNLARGMIIRDAVEGLGGRPGVGEPGEQLAWMDIWRARGGYRAGVCAVGFECWAPGSKAE